MPPMSVMDAMYFRDELIPPLKMYYEPNASRSNLSVLTSAHVARISLSKGSDGATAKSVIFIHDGKEYQVLVNKRVILSAG